MSGIGNRTAKAWRVRPVWSDDSDIYFASTASRARYACMRSLGDCCPDLQFKDLQVHRARECDRAFPEPHWIVAELSREDRNVILHAFGADSRSPGYRDHYCTNAGHGRLLRLAWELGIFHGPYGEQAYGETGSWSGVFYYLTEFGRHVARSMLPLYPGEKDRPSPAPKDGTSKSGGA